MTKAQEIEELDKMIKKFGDDSYIGPWLKERRDTIVWAIENDYPISVALLVGRT